MNTDEWGPGTGLLLTRASPVDDAVLAFDDWQRAKHLPELMRAPNTHAVFYGGHTPIPSGSREQAQRLAIYSFSSLDALKVFVASSEVSAAIQDGSRWFGRFLELDGAPYSGNMYQVDEAFGSGFATLSVLYVERFEIPPAALPEFDKWLIDIFSQQLMETEHVLGVRICSASREQGQVPHYLSRGNRAVLCAVAPKYLPFVAQEGLFGTDAERDFPAPTPEFSTREMFVRITSLPA